MKFAISHFDDRAALEGLGKIILKCSFYENSAKNEEFSLTLLNAVIPHIKEIKSLVIITEFNTKNLDNTPGHAILNFLVRVYQNQKIDQKFFLINISTCLTQNVLLERNKMCSWVNTWNYTDVVLLEDIKIETLKAVLLEHADQFKISFEKANS